MLKNFFIVIGLLSIVGGYTTAYAGWPIFTVLTTDQIQTLETTEGCPTGEVRIPQGTQVPILNREIPSREHWFWDYQGQGQCFLKMENLTYLSLEQNGREYPSVITTNYGFIGNPALVQFVFHIPQLPWDCGYFAKANPPIYIGCAQDE